MVANTSYTRTKYDKINRTTDVYFYDHTTGKEKQLQHIDYSRSVLDHVITTTTYMDDTRAAVTKSTYDYADRLLETVYPDNSVETKKYTKGGLVSRATNTAGHTTTFEYDLWGNMLKQTGRFDAQLEAETSYQYDKNGKVTIENVKNNLAGASSSTRKTEYVNDKWGRTTAVVFYEGSTAVNYVQSYYDWQGRLLRQYKGLSKPLTITGLDMVTPTGDNVYSVLKYEYDYLGKVKKSTDALGKEEVMTYYPSGLPHTTLDRNGTLHTVIYDLRGNPKSSTSTKGQDTTAKTYEYDSMGNMSTANDGTGIIGYGYNGRGNLVSETKGSTVKTFTHDNTGAVTGYTIKIGGVLKQNVSYYYIER